MRFNLGLQRFPLLRITLAVIGGMLLATEFSLDYLIASLTCLVLCLSLSLLFMRPNGQLASVLSSSMVLLAAVLFGYWLQQERQIQLLQMHRSWKLDIPSNCTFRIEEVRNSYAIASMRAMDGIEIQGKFVLYTGDTVVLREHDLVYARIIVQKIPGKKNPRAFNYQNYQEKRGILHQAYLHSHIILDADHAWFWQNLLLKIRQVAKHRLNQLPHQPEIAVASALLLGDKRYLDDDLRNAYADTGAMHVLAVSGLHVGIIYLLIRGIFSLAARWKNRRWLRSIISIMAVWIFAGLAGAAPSVCRAAFMLTVIEIGYMLGRPAYALNSLAFAALIMLVFEPLVLWQISFQLSFLAVAGILLFQKHLEKLWTIANPWGHKLWTLTCVSFSAQIFTLPLVLHNFHQFPVFFWLSSAPVVILATFILPVGLIYILVAPIPLLGEVFQQLLNALLVLLNALINLLQKIPNATVEDIWLNSLELVVLVLVLCFAAFALSRRSYQVLKFTLVLASFFLFLTAVFPQWIIPEPAVNIYHIRGHSLADQIGQQRAIIYNPDSLENPYALRDLKNQSSYYQISQIEETSILGHLEADQMFFGFGPYKIISIIGDLILDDSIPSADIIWLRHGGSLISKRSGSDNKATYVIDGSTPHWRASRLTQRLEDLGYLVHNTWRDGALSLPIQ